MSKKQFVLDTLLPYFADPTTCGINPNDGTCTYLAPNGNRCAAGKHLLPQYQDSNASIQTLLNQYGPDIFTDEAQKARLSPHMWGYMQNVHDYLAKKLPEHLGPSIMNLENKLGEPLPELLEALNRLVERGDWFVSGSGTED